MSRTLTGTESRQAPLLVVMGVSGSGKSVVGAALAQRLRVSFVDADDLPASRSTTTTAAPGWTPSGSGSPPTTRPAAWSPARR